ncbi:MAG: hypothetical protein AUJ07_03820 [Crenarchaeota archaeon 13_1_40CM_3_53_5]|nr:MAG: hypothetical protein AUJ07_03820 [Crenarchaeota archaeon 13_1_40CM_3_53_5]
MQKNASYLPTLRRWLEAHLNPSEDRRVKMILKSKAKSVSTVKPMILYSDEGGNYKSHQAEPVQVTLKELGIPGWLTGH